ncbi:hypothetical protein [Bradyrhizobium sp. LMTR 3]|uniref:hypothetical protein n=1 Tax=Bradyrhizobium sp. LMTR 3 TaxID=189873 RepID=UPI000810616A|nr:hypothetical protein [Bradyrhizobium sp. LMTR 3]OCK56774.1 hypothetical protein LMTR3_14160 [Bradyrhizobium sp. LMTR 3]
MHPTLAKPIAADIALPDVAASRLRRLGDASAEKHAAVLAASDRVNQQRERQQNAEATIRRQIAVFRLPEDTGDPEVMRLKNVAASASAEAQRLEVIRDERGAAWQAINRIVEACEGWVIGSTGANDFEVVEVVPEMKKGETLTDAAKRAQRRGRELQGDLHRVQSAPRPSAWAKQAMRSQIAQLAERGRPHVGALVEHGSEITFADVRRSARVANVESPAALAQWVEPDLLSLFAFVHQDALVAALDREIEAEADDANALTDDDRRRREDEISDDIMANARTECAMIWQQIDAGAPIAFRDGLPAEAVLGLKAVPKPPAPDVPYEIKSWAKRW